MRSPLTKVEAVVQAARAVVAVQRGYCPRDLGSRRHHAWERDFGFGFTPVARDRVAMASAGYMAHVRYLTQQHGAGLREAAATAQASGMHSLPGGERVDRVARCADEVARVVGESWPVLTHIAHVLVEAGGFPGDAVADALAFGAGPIRFVGPRT